MACTRNDDAGVIPETIPFLVDVVSASRAAKGGTVIVDLDTIPLREPRQRHAHAASLIVSGEGQVDTVAATMNAAEPGYNLLGAYEQMTMKDGAGYTYFAGVTGRDLFDDMQAIHGVNVIDDPEDIADADATDDTIGITLAYLFARYDRERRKFGREGLVPVASLKSGNAQLQFRIASNLPGTPAGVTWDGFTAGLEVWMHVVYLEEVVHGPKWAVEVYDHDELNGALAFPERLVQYAAIRFEPEDTGGQDNSDYDGLSVTVGGMSLKSALGSDQLAFANALMHSLDPLYADFGDLDLAEASPGWSFLIEPCADFKGMAQGNIAFRIKTRSTHTTNRILMRTWSAKDDEARGKLEAAAGVRGASSVLLTASPRPPSGRLAAFIPSGLFKG